ncbi:uncharacterized protein LOC130391619 isoform X1 [Gadus chalcogrammus]|nr:uncharacterized protein LOC130378864 isoform X1 [Gadus chalcogrammus]XP_056446329.1 uncharacterized protein LOC130382539 isoform X1 [Gadus chalcogrammus]XP_056457815.1 uncharacterized protein LOC130391619 isoform X1 [Gadus chalcogrammus]
MTRSCCAVNCTNRQKDGRKLFNIPRGSHPFAKRRRRLWLQAIKRADWGPEGPKGGESLCSAHFVSGSPSMDCDSPDFVPSVFSHSSNRDISGKVARYERKRIRDEDKAPATCPTSQPEADTVDYSEDECKFVSRKEMHQLNLQYNQLRDDYEALKRELYATQEENKHLKEQLKQSKFGFDSIKDTNAKIIFFTGLQSLQMVMWLLDIVKRSTLVLKGGLSWENHLLLVLMKVRLGLTNRDLAYRFGLPFSTVSKILRDWIPMLSSIVKPLIMWPSKDAVRANMPKCFKPKFRNCRCIIDCTEIFIERTHNLKARAETWSNYKHQNTMKYLIGITPAGAISFLSSGWGGRASDKVITLDSAFLGKLEHGDEILADRGFLVREDLASVGATLRIPSFTKGKSQLPGSCVDTSRQLSRVRIHVERVIGQLKTFKILNTVIPISQVDMLDDILTICAGLTNLRGAVVARR